MGKISPVSSKYVIHTSIETDGTVDRPDIIGAIFGQTEGLLGVDLELRELQRSGRIGRIDVKLDTKSGKTAGTITLPSSLDKSETAIIGAAMETIQRIGPCNATVKVEKIEDVRIAKRNFIISRAKELLRTLTDVVLPDSLEITNEVAQSVSMMAVSEYGKDKLPAGPGIDDAEEIIIVEGRADVLNLLKNGFKNVIAMNGTSVPQTIIDLSKKKITTIFVDGDRGGDLIIKELTQVAEIDYAIKAPDGKEVEELTKKEIHKVLRGRVAIEQIKLEIEKRNPERRPPMFAQKPRGPMPRPRMTMQKTAQISDEQKTNFKQMLDDLVGTRGAYLLDQSMTILGKVPLTELGATVRSLNSIYAIVFDGEVTQEILQIAERSNIKYVVGMNTEINPSNTRIEILTNNDFV
mgnify:CR=1 FL=1